MKVHALMLTPTRSSRNNQDDFEAGGGMRADITELIAKHRYVPSSFCPKNHGLQLRGQVKLGILSRATIDELRKAVGEALLQTSPEYDDIFLLRFVLTWEKRGGLPKAIDAVKETIEYRRKNKAILDEGCRPGGKFPNEDKVLIHLNLFPSRPPSRKRTNWTAYFFALQHHWAANFESPHT
jgi:hypothetical protein